MFIRTGLFQSFYICAQKTNICVTLVGLAAERGRGSEGEEEEDEDKNEDQDEPAEEDEEDDGEEETEEKERKEDHLRYSRPLRRKPISVLL